MTETTIAKAAPPTGFWARASIGKAVLLVVAYVAFYTLVAQIVQRLSFNWIDTGDVLGTATTILLAVALPIGIGGAALYAFTARMGWVGAVFGRQPVPGRRWMWGAPILVVLAILGHLLAIDWSRWGAGQLASLAVVGACVGFTEELATRGLVVKIVRDAGHREQIVALTSTLLFSLMHLSNLLSGMDVSVVGMTVVYTFGFGMCMYLTMRVTGTIWAAIVLHALTDPISMLATGGIDTTATDVHTSTGISLLILVSTVALILFGIVSAFLVRGRAGEPLSEPVPAQ